MKKNKIIIVSFLIFLILGLYSRVFFSAKKSSNEKDVQCLPGKTYINKSYLEKNTGLSFVKFQGGCFKMGSDKGETGRNSDEGPITKIEIDEFYLSTTEVRKKDFLLFVSETDYKTTAEIQGFSWVFLESTGNWEKKKNISWKNPGYSQDLDHPVVHVSFYDAKKFCLWLSAKNKEFKFRLPTEAEWEYAARGGLRGGFYPLENNENLCSFANGADLKAKNKFTGWKVSECVDGFVFTSPVKSLKPDASGLYDMFGNVWEWCDSEYDTKLFKKNKKIYGKSSKVVIRGGSFYSKPEYLRFSSRDYLSSPEKRGYDIGFRLVMVKK